MPGIGPIISTAVVAAIGGGDGFAKGRDFAACAGVLIVGCGSIGLMAVAAARAKAPDRADIFRSGAAGVQGVGVAKL